MISETDISFAANTDMMLAKNRIIGAVYEMFGRLSNAYRLETINLPERLTRQHPKISKGENYLSLPWVMLDYPRNYSVPDIFAIRTMFWWGHHFSLQLLLQGKYLPILKLANLMNPSPQKDWFFCTGDTPWEHHFDDAYMQPLHLISSQQMQQQKEINGFYKIGVKLPVGDWELAEQFLTENFLVALRLIAPVPDIGN